MKLLTLSEGSETDFATDVISFPGASVLFKQLTITDGATGIDLTPTPYALCPMPYALCPMI